MSESMTFEEFCLDLVGTCQHCDGTGRAARPLSTEIRGCEVCNGRLCHEALEIPIARRLFDHLTATGVDVGAVLRGERALGPSALDSLLRDLRFLAAPKATEMGANLESEHELASAKRIPSVVRWAEQTLRALSKDSAVSDELTQAPPDLTSLRKLAKEWCRGGPGAADYGTDVRRETKRSCADELTRALDALEAAR